jgi:hypothetical protein
MSAKNACGCLETYPQLVPGKVSHGPGCELRTSDTPSRNEVLEEAAIVCEEWPSSPMTAQKVTCLELAAAIRRLKELNPEQRHMRRVAESQAPSIRDGDTGVAPGRGHVAPDDVTDGGMSDTPITDANVVRGFDALRITKDEEQWVRAEVVRALERELNATRIIAGVASKERGEWAAERKDLREALATLVGIKEADYAPWFIEPGSELGLALAAAKKALLIWRHANERHAEN